MGKRAAVLLGLAWAGLGVARPAQADPLPRAPPGEGAFGWLSEARLGVALHGAGAARERSVDLNGEVLFVSPFPRAWAEGLPNRWAWVAAPRVHLGAAPNLGGYTSKVYAGLTWTAALARDVMWAGDALRFDFFFGGSLHDGKLETDDPERRALAAPGCSGWAPRSAGRPPRGGRCRRSSTATRTGIWPRRTGA